MKTTRNTASPGSRDGGGGGGGGRHVLAGVLTHFVP